MKYFVRDDVRNWWERDYTSPDFVGFEIFPPFSLSIKKSKFEVLQIKISSQRI